MLGCGFSLSCRVYRPRYGRCIGFQRSPALLLMLFLWVGRPVLQADEEYQAKARFLKIAVYYAEFPISSTPTRPWRIGILGQSPFGNNLEEIFKPSVTVRGRSVQVLFLQQISDVENLDVLFICGSEGDRLKEILSRLAGSPVLTVGDTPGFIQRGVMVNFFLEGTFIRTEVNLQATRQAHLDFSASFLKLSRVFNR